MSGKIPSTSGDNQMNSSFSSGGGSGRPIQIVDITSDHKFKLNEENLQHILSHPKARMKKVCVVSVAGAFRKGKSFLLDFFLRYLSKGGREDWMGSDDEPLTGFHWKGGSERDTTGILMWSEPFILKRNDNKEEASFFHFLLTAFILKFTRTGLVCLLSQNGQIRQINSLFSFVCIFKRKTTFEKKNFHNFT